MLDDENATLFKYQNAPGIDNKLQVQYSGKTRHFMQDHLGSTVGITNESGNISTTNSYDSFGNPSNSTFFSRYQFTGREYDSFTGLQYSRARFYDPQIGRFLSEDPIGFKGKDINLYGYVRNRPLKYKDPKGLDIVVVENGPTAQSVFAGGNPLGHTAVAISGKGIFSYGNGNPNVPGVNIIGGSLSGYLNSQSCCRSTRIWVMKTSPEQIKRSAEIGH